MYPKHPITILLNFILFLISLLFLKNSIFLFFIILAIYFINRYTLRKNYYLFLTATLTIAIWNLLFGKLTLIVKVFLLIIYMIELTKDFTKIDIFYMYDTLFSFTDRKFILFILKCIDYKTIFKENYKILSTMNKKMGYKSNSKYYLYALKQCILTTKEEVNDNIVTYQRSLYLNKASNKYKTYFSYQDVLMIMLHMLLLTFVYYLGRSSYAIFH